MSPSPGTQDIHSPHFMVTTSFLAFMALPFKMTSLINSSFIYLNNFIEVQLIHKELYIFNMCSLMSLDINTYDTNAIIEVTDISNPFPEFPCVPFFLLPFVFGEEYLV